MHAERMFMVAIALVLAVVVAAGAARSVQAHLSEAADRLETINLQ